MRRRFRPYFHYTPLQFVIAVSYCCKFQLWCMIVEDIQSRIHLQSNGHCDPPLMIKAPFPIKPCYFVNCMGGFHNQRTGIARGLCSAFPNGHPTSHRISSGTLYALEMAASTSGRRQYIWTQKYCKPYIGAPARGLLVRGTLEPMNHRPIPSRISSSMFISISASFIGVISASPRYYPCNIVQA